MSAIIALLTDFGTSDTYVGTMKAVMLNICPHAHFIDLSHEIQPQNVGQGAFALVNSYRYLPKGTVFLVVIDPSVGSSRHPIAAQAGDYCFVAPDNGVLSYVFTENAASRVVMLENSAYQLQNVSTTFHGRDIFAPAAAHLAAGTELTAFGNTVEDVVLLPVPRLEVTPQRITGEIIHIDHFGNIITSIGRMRWQDGEHLRMVAQDVTINAARVRLGTYDVDLSGIHHSYSETSVGDLLMLIGSSGYLEISVNQGHAAARLDANVGDTIQIEIG